MSGKISEFTKADVGYGPFTIADGGTGETEWFSMEDYGKFMAVVTASSMETSENIRVHLKQAKTSTGLGATKLSNTGSTATLTGARRAASVSMTFTSAVLGRAVGSTMTWKINGLTFTATSLTTANVAASRFFSIDTGASTRAVSAAIQLSSAINNPTYGVTGVSATAGTTGNMTLTVDDPGSITIDVSSFSSTDAGFVAGSLNSIQSQTYVEVNSQQMKINDGFKFIRAEFSSSAITDIHIQVLRADAANRPVPAVITT